MQSGTFSNGTWNKQSAFFMGGFDAVQFLFKDRTGTLTPSGSGSVQTNFVSSFFDPNLVVGGSQSNPPSQAAMRWEAMVARQRN